MASIDFPATLVERPIERLGARIVDRLAGLGDLAVFSLRTMAWLFTRFPRPRTLLPCLYNVGVRSVGVVAVTGAFIGMVLAVQTYDEFRRMHLESRLGAIISVSLVRELGPVLAAVMLAGRVGSAMAAELGTMRVTEQIDALDSLGANPIHYLVVPRFLACFLLIPLLTALADFIGVLGGGFLATHVLGVDHHQYWLYASDYVTAFDVFAGLGKSVFFGAAIALVSCHRGFRCDAGAEGVGKAATEAFVYSFIAILILDFFLGMFTMTLYRVLWPDGVTLM